MTTSNPTINSFVELALKAKDQAFAFSLQAKEQAIELSERVRSGKTFNHPEADAKAAVALNKIQTVCTVVGALSLLTYLVPTFWHKIAHCPQNLTKKYGAKWGLVTGGSSGIVSIIS